MNVKKNSIHRYQRFAINYTCENMKKFLGSFFRFSLNLISTSNDISLSRANFNKFDKMQVDDHFYEESILSKSFDFSVFIDHVIKKILKIFTITSLPYQRRIINLYILLCTYSFISSTIVPCRKLFSVKTLFFNKIIILFSQLYIFIYMHVQCYINLLYATFKLVIILTLTLF